MKKYDEKVAKSRSPYDLSDAFIVTCVGLHQDKSYSRLLARNPYDLSNTKGNVGVGKFRLESKGGKR